jgi:hypothetical protein
LTAGVRAADRWRGGRRERPARRARGSRTPRSEMTTIMLPSAKEAVVLPIPDRWAELIRQV